ncbi:MAG TPA: tetratricopeptide repeat protein [Flavisolibacter sp.]|nr:tetratricopeptide repeat protein [Flavisolibacter sp.]
MKKSASLLILSVFLTLASFAQSIQEGMGHMYAERYASARSTFEKMVASNPNNMEAVYWLGQTHLANDDVAAARQVYEKALAANGNAPLVLVGMGHVELTEGKTAEARQRFETAISLSKGKKGDDPNVLNAIGRANVEVRGGDAAYAIEKLTAAHQAAPANADIMINLGNAYRQAKEGGKAVEYYIKASQLAPALANYRMARVYETQRNWDVVTDHLNKAIAADSKFAPAYLRLYTYHLLYKNDPATADQWAQKYISAADPSPEHDIFRAQTAYQQKNYDQAISMGQNVINQTKQKKLSPSVYRLMAYSYVGKGDTAAAKPFVDQLFEKYKADERVGPDYTLKAAIYSKENPEEVVNIYLDAASEDTSLRNKQIILLEGIDWAKANNKKIPEADLRLAFYKINPSPNPASLFQVGLPYYQGGAYAKADSAFTAYATALPDSIYGHYWSGLSRAQIDTSLEQGLAVPAFEKALQIAATDKVRFKSQGIQAAGYLAGYYNNIKKDKEAAISYLEKGLEFDPNNTTFQNTIKALQAPAKKTTTPSKTTPAKSGTKTTTSSSGATKKPAGSAKG